MCKRDRTNCHKKLIDRDNPRLTFSAQILVEDAGLSDACVANYDELEQIVHLYLLVIDVYHCC